MTSAPHDSRAAIAALDRIPLFADVPFEDITLEPLGGLTNRNVKVSVPFGEFVLRIPGAGTDAYIDRRSEAHNARIAAEVGVGPELVFFEPHSGLMLFRFIAGATTMTDASVARPDGLRIVARTLRCLHDSQRAFRTDFDPFAQLDRYLTILESSGLALPPGFTDSLTAARALQPALASGYNVSAPCHCDLLADNLLLQGERLFIVDYEFSGNTDPLWDLADLAGEVDLTPEQDMAFLQAYCDGPASTTAWARMVAWKAVSLLLACGWSLVQVVNGNTTLDFDAYATLRLRRSQAIRRSPHWRRSVAALTRPDARADRR